ncbi:amidophosphoribosyltransferase [Sphingomonas sp. Leaf339]|uniref:ComF family protein n=1 Tax=Sphingomonas sp. Leaf339 TaxID=1736343 RepID=UPI0006F234EB|nr:double zinc ribbon domain-containing protein [Sphingomonas sp. Leaf339]KQU56146.1 amidophosphoribosyltransferase [Sphingomonas sp. Leaf339]
MLRSILRPLRWIADYALPPRCPGCGVPVAEDHQFCGTCWSALRFLGPPWCAACHVPFAFDRGEGAICATCAGTPPRHAGVRAAVAYGDVAGALAVRLKHGGRIALANTMARAMLRLMPAQGDLLVPVPLHRGRLWRRGFNQAALIADVVSQRTGVPRDHHALQRRRATPLLRGLGRRARARAVAGVFVVDRARRESIRGRAVVLVDDVYTTGATTTACTRALLAAGARSVTILCWARVLPDAADD